jgi:hypothetical protein
VLLTVGTKITLYVVAERLKWHRRLLGRHQGVLEQVRDEIAPIVILGPDARQPTLGRAYEDDLPGPRYQRVLAVVSPNSRKSTSCFM